MAWILAASPVVAAPANPLLQEVQELLAAKKGPYAESPAAEAVPTAVAAPPTAPKAAPGSFSFVNLPPLTRTLVDHLPDSSPLPPPKWDEPPRPPETMLPDESGVVTCEQPFALTPTMRVNPWEVRIAPVFTYDEHPLLLESILIGKETSAVINKRFVLEGESPRFPFTVVAIRSSEVIVQYRQFKFALPEGRTVKVRIPRP